MESGFVALALLVSVTWFRRKELEVGDRAAIVLSTCLILSTILYHGCHEYPGSHYCVDWARWNGHLEWLSVAIIWPAIVWVAWIVAGTAATAAFNRNDYDAPGAAPAVVQPPHGPIQ